MPGQIDIIKVLLPVIVRLYPELVAGEITVGKIVPLMNVDPQTDEEALRKLARKLKVKAREKFNDNTHVVKISEVKKCIEDQLLKDKTFFLQFVKWAAKNLIGSGGGSLDKGPMQVFIDSVVECCREKALKQTWARKYQQRVYMRRQSRGVGG